MGSPDNSAAPATAAAANPTPPAAAAAAAAQGPAPTPPPGWPSSSQHHNIFYHQRTTGPYPSPIAPPAYPHLATFPPHAAVTASQMYIAGVEAARRAAGTKKKLEGFPEQIRDDDDTPNSSVTTSAAHVMGGQEENLPGHPSVKDDRELKKERRKQSNRESARRSRIRKQECKELTKRVRELNNENSSLTDELDQLNKSCDGLEALNSSMQEELISRYGPICCLNSYNNNDDLSTDTEEN